MVKITDDEPEPDDEESKQHHDKLKSDNDKGGDNKIHTIEDDKSSAYQSDSNDENYKSNEPTSSKKITTDEAMENGPDVNRPKQLQNRFNRPYREMNLDGLSIHD